MCRPLRGGTKVGDTTLSLVIKVRNGTKQEMLAILSGHGIGGVGAEVGQPTRLTGKFGSVAHYQTATRITSDASLASITLRRDADVVPYLIWRRRDTEQDGFLPESVYTVDRLDGDVSAGDGLGMQGMVSAELQVGSVIMLDATIVTSGDRRVTLNNQVLADYGAQQGDSGAPVFSVTNVNQRKATYRGIHAGREIVNGVQRSFFSPWENIQKDFNLYGVVGVFQGPPESDSESESDSDA